MIKNKIFYAVAIAYSAVLAILYNEYSMLLVFFVIASIPFVLFILLLYIRSKVSAEINPDLMVVNKGADIGLTITVRNQSNLPISYLSLVLVANNGFAKQKTKYKISCFVDGKSQQKLQCSLSSNHCGNIEVSCKSIRIYDYLRIFYLKKAMNQSIKITVLPEPYEIEEQIKFDYRNEMMESDVYSKIKSGDDPSEVFAIRDYQQGDKLHRIHWKLSTKKKQFLVKEYSLPIGCSVCILLEFHFKGNEKEQLTHMDGLLETMLSLSYSLIQSDCPHIISWYDKEQDEFRQVKVNTEEDVYMVVEEVLHIKLYNQMGKAIELQQILSSQEQLTNLYYIGTDFSLEQGELLRELYQGVHLHMVHINNSVNEVDNKKLMNQLEGLRIQGTLLHVGNLEAGIKALEI